MVRGVTAACRRGKCGREGHERNPVRAIFSNEESPGRVKFYRTRIVPVGSMKYRKKYGCNRPTIQPIWPSPTEEASSWKSELSTFLGLEWPYFCPDLSSKFEELKLRALLKEATIPRQGMHMHKCTPRGKENIVEEAGKRCTAQVHQQMILHGFWFRIWE